MPTILPGGEPARAGAQEGSPAVGLSVGRRGSGPLTGSRPCPHLAATDGRALPYEHASAHNACGAQPRRVWQGLRRVTLPHSRVTRERQKQHCLAAFAECEFYRPPSEQAAAPAAARPRAQPEAPPRPARPRRRRRREARPARGWSTAAQLGAIGAVAAAVAFAVSLFFSPSAHQWYGKLALMFLKSNAGSLGISAESLERAEEAGLLNPANLRQLKNLKNLSPSQRNKLKSPDAFKNLSEAERARLKRAIQKR